MNARSQSLRSRGRDSRSRHFPVALYVAALAVIAAALPTMLRPPPDTANNAAELSPDAPPDEDQEAIVASLNRGTSGTAADGTASVGAGEGGPPPPAATPPPPPPVAPPRFCPGGWGDPPRQVESWYSAPCAPAWQGDNGGATYKGVGASEVRVGFVLGSSTSNGLSLGEDEGPEISDTPPPEESAGHRSWRVYQQYLNQNFQLWGRRLRFFVLTVDDGNDNSAAEMRAAVQTMDEGYHVFAIYSLSTPALTETGRRELVGLGGWSPTDALYGNNQPYLVAWYMDGTRLMRINAEYMCKRLLGRAAVHAGDPSFRSQPRKLGVITEDWDAYGSGIGANLPGLVREQCGAEMVVQRFNSANPEQSYPTAVSQFRLNDVTTVVTDLDARFLTGFLTAAEAQGYFPEWFIPGTYANDQTELPFFLQYNRRQWSHAFGISPWTIAHLPVNRDSFRAYRTIDPANDPNGADTFAHLLQLANGIQMAGPELTPLSFREGLNAMGTRTPEPPWGVTGGFGPDDHSYIDDVAEIWWDDTAPNPYWGNSPGSYRYVDCGRRLGLGAIPSTAPRVFDAEGTCSAGPGPG